MAVPSLFILYNPLLFITLTPFTSDILLINSISLLITCDIFLSPVEWASDWESHLHQKVWAIAASENRKWIPSTQIAFLTFASFFSPLPFPVLSASIPIASLGCQVPSNLFSHSGLWPSCYLLLSFLSFSPGLISYFLLSDHSLDLDVRLSFTYFVYLYP